jgi:hypothetical protein
MIPGFKHLYYVVFILDVASLGSVNLRQDVWLGMS